MLQAPRESPYDWNFTLLGFPVRIAWGFWIVAALLGWNWSLGVDGAATSIGATSPGAPALLIVWAFALLLSILVHELGHTIAFRYYGIRSSIVLYHFGGLAIPSSFGAWDGARRGNIGAKEQIVISAAGPAFQLGLAAIVWIIGLVTNIPMELTGQLNWFLGTTLPMGDMPGNILSYAVLDAILWPSTVWAVLNLAPILPLDGGHIMKSLLQINNVNQPTRTAHFVSVVAGALLGIYFLQSGQPGGIMFLLFAASNWQAMQSGYGSF
ncbi:MAG: site-2 protease family protein [Aureliella sp.]